MIKKIFSNRSINSAGMFAISLLVSNFASFLFNAVLGRVLSFSDFGIITLLNSFWYLLSIFINALGSTVIHKVAFLNGREGEKSANDFYQYFSSLIRKPIIFICAIWLLLTPILVSLFHLSSMLPVILFSPAIYLGTYSLVNRSFLQGKLLFVIVSITILIENVSRLIIAVIFVMSPLKQYTYLSIPISILLAYLSAKFYINKISTTMSSRNNDYTFPIHFFTATFLSGLSVTAFITIDVILVTHFFDGTTAGKYALLALIGKLIYFFGTLLNGALFTHASNSEGKKENSLKLFYSILAISSLGILAMYILLGPLGGVITPILFGNKVNSISLYLTPYSLGISLFTISNIVSSYYLAKQKYIFSAIGIVSTILLTIGITLFHTNLLQIIYVILTVSLLSLISTGLLHILVTYIKDE